MSVYLEYKGRLANRLLIYLMGQYFADKNNLKFDENIDYPEMNKNFIINKISGNLSYDSVVEIHDNNIKDYLDTKIEKNIHLTGYYQVPIIFNDDIIKKYKSYIIPKKLEPTHDLFVHVRLGDIQGRWDLPFSYYDKQILKIQFNKGIISSDSLNHPTVQNLISKYNLDVLEESPEFTIRYASQCKNIVLSSGTFSLIIGMLSNDSNVYFINGEKSEKHYNIGLWMGPAFDAFVDKQGWILFD